MILHILQIIGLCLLILLLIFLALILIILFVPIHYEIKGYKKPPSDGTEPGFEADIENSSPRPTASDPDWRVMARVHWILYAIRGSVQFDPGGLQYAVYIFWKKLLASEEESPEEKGELQETDGKEAEASGPFTIDNLDFTDAPAENTEENVDKELFGAESSEISKTDEQKTCMDETREASSSIEKAPKDADLVTAPSADDYTVLKEPGDPDELVLPEEADLSQEDVSSYKADLQDSPVGIQSEAKLKDLVRKVQNIWQKLTDENNQEAFQLALHEIKYLLHHIRLRRIEGDFTFGFDDPATMGQVLSILAFLYPKLYGRVTVNPLYDVDETIFYGRIYMKGHIRLIHVLIAAIKILMNKTQRTMIFGRKKK